MSTEPLRPVWLDTDPGFDDWLTMLMLAADARVDWVGTSVVAGNAPLDRTLANALAIRQHYGLSAPIHVGCAAPLAGRLETAQRVLGQQGMRTRGVSLPPASELPAGEDGVQALLDALHTNAQPMTVVAIGPLTNLATALARDSSASARIREVLLMGGSTDRGNHTPAAEFNIYADPEAADVVFNAGIPLRMFGLNVCRQVLIDPSHVRQVRHWPGLRAQWLAGYLDAYQRLRSADGSVPMPLYDPVVTAWLAAPQLFEFSAARVDIELQGRFTRGMTVCDFKVDPQRPFNAQVAMGADGPAVVRVVMDCLHRSLSQGESSRP
ncbi:MAG TPA: nucleoside hydrolase [Ramlibacter sp.]|nr:nucleoside hydrolase [Ramlibacter sp.]